MLVHIPVQTRPVGYAPGIRTASEPNVLSTYDIEFRRIPLSLSLSFLLRRYFSSLSRREKGTMGLAYSGRHLPEGKARACYVYT